MYLLIMVTVYLIICNIFQISVIQDIQSYGQLKTLGISAWQIKRLINRQPMRLSAIGIPIGLLAGFLIGKAMLPFLMDGTVYRADAGAKGSANPLILLTMAIPSLLYRGIAKAKLQFESNVAFLQYPNRNL